MGTDPFSHPMQRKELSTGTGYIAVNSDGYAGGGLLQGWDTERAIRDGYNISSWVNWAVTGHMRSIAGVPWYLSKKNSQNEWHRVENSEPEGLLYKPNRNLTRQGLFQFAVSHLYLGGNSLWKLVFGTKAKGSKYPLGKIPTEIWPLYPWKTKVIPVRGSDMEIERYDYGAWPRKQSYTPDEVLHLKFENPGDLRWGIGRLQAIARLVDMDVAAIKWNLGSLMRRAVPSGVFSFENRINRPQWEEATDWIKESISGPDAAHNPLVLGNKAVYQAIERTPQEMDWLRTREASRDEIAIMFGYHPSMVSSKASTFNNMENAIRYVWELERIPFLEMVMETLNKVLIPYFGDPDNLSFQYDLSKVTVLQRNIGDQVKTFAMGVQNRIPPSHMSKILELDLEPFEGDDVSMVPKNFIPMTDYTNPPEDGSAVTDQGAGNTAQTGQDGQESDKTEQGGGEGKDGQGNAASGASGGSADETPKAGRNQVVVRAHVRTRRGSGVQSEKKPGSKESTLQIPSIRVDSALKLDTICKQLREISSQYN